MKPNGSTAAGWYSLYTSVGRLCVWPKSPGQKKWQDRWFWVRVFDSFKLARDFIIVNEDVGHIPDMVLSSEDRAMVEYFSADKHGNPQTWLPSARYILTNTPLAAMGLCGEYYAERDGNFGFHFVFHLSTFVTSRLLPVLCSLLDDCAVKLFYVDILCRLDDLRSTNALFHHIHFYYLHIISCLL